MSGGGAVGERRRSEARRRRRVIFWLRQGEMKAADADAFVGTQHHITCSSSLLTLSSLRAWSYLLIFICTLAVEIRRLPFFPSRRVRSRIASSAARPEKNHPGSAGEMFTAAIPHPLLYACCVLRASC